VATVIVAQAMISHNMGNKKKMKKAKKYSDLYSYLFETRIENLRRRVRLSSINRYRYMYTKIQIQKHTQMVAISINKTRLGVGVG